jgi:hypothetical protein
VVEIVLTIDGVTVPTLMMVMYARRFYRKPQATATGP